MELVKKYENRFLRLDNNSRINGITFRRVPAKTAGRPVEEIMLNYNQVLFLSSLMRGSDQVHNFQECLIKQSSIAKAIELLNSIDIDDIPVRYVYAMQDDQGRIKIGISNDPDRRVREIQASNGGEISLIMVKKTSTKRYTEETELHALCESHLIHSEWFSQEAVQLLEVA